MLFKNELLNLFDGRSEETMFSKMNVPDIMRTDSYEYESNLIYEIELPGYEKEEVRAKLQDGYLIIMAAKPASVEDSYNLRTYSFRERHVGGCMRRFYVGDEIQKENIHASMKDGILEIIIDQSGNRINDQKKYLE